MLRKQISQYLFERIKDAGVDCTFGIPGDFVLPLYAAQQKAGLRTVVMTHEPAVGFAADAYARLRGLGVALVTYGAGGLNMVNATALAYAEESPLLVISGGPEVKYRSQKAVLHHCVKTFATQNNVYSEVTAANAVICDPARAKQDIDSAFEAIISSSRPAYLEIPRDLVNSEIECDEDAGALKVGESLGNRQMQELINSVRAHIGGAKKAVIMSGVQISRYRLLEPILRISEALNIPVVSSVAGKSSFPETHPNFVGIYYGQFGDDAVRDFFESCDCIIAPGVVLTEIETGGFSAKLPEEKFILINNEEIVIEGVSHKYSPPNFAFKAFITALADDIVSGARSGELHKFVVPDISRLTATSSADNPLNVAHIISTVNNVMDSKICIICDVGDCLYAGLSIKTDYFIAPGYYSSMGFGVPACVGVQIADKNKRPLVLVGDGGFQMTGTELSTAVKEGLNPIIVVFNNASYAMLKFIELGQERAYYNLPVWDYVGFACALGAEGYQARTAVQFDQALHKAIKSSKPVLIDAILTPDDISPILKRMTEFFGKKMRAASAR